MTHNANYISRLSPQCGDNPRVVVRRGREIVAAMRRQSQPPFFCVEIVQSLIAQSDHLSLAPGFSQVSGVCVIEEPFQRFLRAGGKPLKRFAHCAVVNTRLKPGANEMDDVITTGGVAC